jgi:hypothetical protein
VASVPIVMTVNVVTAMETILSIQFPQLSGCLNATWLPMGTVCAQPYLVMVCNRAVQPPQRGTT